MIEANLIKLVKLALDEDLGEKGDLTGEFFIDSKDQAKARIFSKADNDIIVSGMEVAREVCSQVDAEINIIDSVVDGAKLAPGKTIINLEGPKRSLLTAERTILNFLQRLSAIATFTNQYVELLKETNTKVLDTRKTTPGWRVIEKAAVAHGGGVNHRMGLYDAVMIKDNHLVGLADFGELQGKIDLFKKKHPSPAVIIEVDTLSQLTEVLKLQHVDRILLDNMNNQQLVEAVQMAGGAIALEASGGINLSTAQGIAKTGVDYISVGALTHSVPAIDLSMEL